MATINLLPWRDKRREEQQKAFLKNTLGFALLGGLLGFAWSYSVNSDIENQNTRNQMLSSEIVELKKKAQEIQDIQEQRDELIARMTVIQSLQGNRPLIVNIFDELVRTLPEGIYFSSIERKGNDLTINGNADSTSRIPVLMRSLDESEWFDQSLTPVIERNEGRSKTFTLKLKITPPMSKDNEEKETTS